MVTLEHRDLKEYKVLPEYLVEVVPRETEDYQVIQADEALQVKLVYKDPLDHLDCQELLEALSSVLNLMELIWDW